MSFSTIEHSASLQIGIVEFDASGLNAKQFCIEKGLGYASFLNRRKRLAKDVSTDPGSFIDLSSLSQAAGSSSWHIELDLGDGMTLRLDRR